MSRTRRFAILAAGFMALSLGAPTALAQLGLSDSIVSQSGQVPPADAEEINRYIETHQAGLSGEPEAIRRSRMALIAPLRGRANVGTAFRVEYGRRLKPVLEPLATGENEAVAINALGIAGQVGSRDTIGTVVNGLRDERPAVRLAAAFALRDTLTTAGQAAAPAVDARQISPAALDALQASLQRVTDPNVANGLVAAFESAVALPAANFAEIRADAATRLATVLAGKAKAAQDLSMLAAHGRGIEALQTALVGAQQPLPASTSKPIGDYAAELIRMAAARAEAGDITEADRPVLATLVAGAETTYIFAQQRAGTRVAEAGLGTLLEQGKDREFVEKARQFLPK